MEHIKKTPPEKTNLISHLMKSKDPDTGGVSLPENQIRDEIMVLAFAGHDALLNTCKSLFCSIFSYPTG